MADTIVEPGYNVLLPEEVRPHISVGQRYTVTMGADGELVLTPVDERSMADIIDDILNHTAGLWRGREDIPDNGVDYVNQLRQGRRLTDLADSRHDR